VGCLLVLAFVGCIRAPERRETDIEVTAPAEWSASDAATAGDVEDEWWKSLGDPRLVELITTGLEQNRNLGAAAARLDRAAAEARIAGADLEPSVGVGFGAARQRQNYIGLPIPGGGDVLSTTTSRYGVSLDVSWEVDLWGRLRAGARAAVADYQATEAELRAARLSLAAQIAKVWFAIIESRQQAALARDTAESRRDSVAQVRTRYESGIRDPLDLRLALSNLANAEAVVTLRERQLDVVARQLEVLLGRYPDKSILDTYGGDDLPKAPAAVPVGLPSELVTRRPDIVAAERRLAATGQRYLEARRSLYPRLFLTGSGGTASNELRDVLDNDFRIWSLVANLTQPLFEGGRLRAGVDRADAVSVESLNLYAQTVLDAFAEVESALAAESYLAGQEKYLAESSRQLTAALALAEDRYRRGVGIYLSVLDSQSRAFAARSELLAVRRLRLDNRVDLHLALGGGFESDREKTR
jgi:NodT family efflux transporter outer membrane factor (OMF) lipoprotein